MGRPRPGALSLGARVIARELRTQPAVVISLLIAVVLSTLVMAGAPRLLEKVAEDDLYATVSEPLPSQRNITLERDGHLGTGNGSDPFAATRRVGDSFVERELPESVGAIVSGHYFLVDSPQLVVSPLPGEEPPHPYPTFFRFRYQEGVEDQTTRVDGSLPKPQEPIEMLVGDDCPDDPAERESLRNALSKTESDVTDLDCHIGLVGHFQTAVTARTAEDMGLAIGQSMLLRADLTDPAYFGVFGDALHFQFVLSISGIVELTDQSDEYWFGDPVLHKPNIQENADRRIIFARGLMSPRDYGGLLSAMGQARWSYAWRLFVDPDLVREADLDRLQKDLTTLGLDYSPVGTSADDLKVVTRLPDLLVDHATQKTQTVALMSLTVAALFGVAVAVSLLLAILMTERQRPAIVLVRSRGASPGQLTMTRFYEALAIVVPAAALGYGFAYALVTDSESLIAYRMTVALAAAVVAGLVTAGLTLYRKRLGSLQRENLAPPGPSSRRVVGEILVVVLAAGATILLRRRGQVDDTAATSGVDLLLAILPILIGLAAAIVTLRVYPHLIRLLAWLGSLRPGVVSFVGFRRILQRSPAHSLPVMVLLLCVATATYASVARVSIETGQEASSWQAVGADYAIKGFAANVTLPASIDLDTLPGSSTVGTGRTFADARIDTDVGSFATEAIAVDSRYDRITADSPTARRLPDSVQVEAEGTESDPLPIIVASEWPGGYEPEIGDMVQLDLGRLQPFAEVVAVRDRYPDMPQGRPFVVMSLETMASISDLPLPPTAAYVRGDRSAGDILREEVEIRAPSARVISRYDILDSVVRDPFVHWVDRALLLITGLAGAFAVASALFALALASSGRRRDFAYLRTMGLETSQTVVLTVLEQAPALLTGVVAGVATGIAIAVLLAPAVSVAAFTGGLVPSTVSISWADLGVLAAVLSLAMTIAVVISVMMSKHDDPARILRIGDE
jgi:putative ABC transport system permease protein